MNTHTPNYLCEASANQRVKSPNPLVLAVGLTALLYFTAGSTFTTKQTSLSQQTSPIVTPSVKNAIFPDSPPTAKEPYSVANRRK